MRKVRLEDNLLVGKPHATPTMPAHIPGVHQGNAPGRRSRASGIRERRGKLQFQARRSTSINPSQRDPLDPSAPNLMPP